ncbi:MAG: hypothetical protein QG645_7 [Patescibacteria group bacterium]|nr:hypothetical protein [Patescibacteria group bacterium]
MSDNNTGSKVAEVVKLLILYSIFCIFLSVIRIIVSHNFELWFLIWNLLLAWVPMVAGYYLYKRTNKFGLAWSKTNALLFALWFVFIPNSFYLMTDFIHLKTVYGMETMFDIVLLMAYAVAGLALGFVSLFIVHLRVNKRFGPKIGIRFAYIILLLSGFAIYLGRYLRWNSWDVLINPFGILYDVSDRVINPSEHGLTFSTTILYFAFLGILYAIIWRASKILIPKQ